MFWQDTTIRIVNLIFAGSTLPFSLLLVRNFIKNGSHDETVRILLLVMFSGVSLAMALSIVIDVRMLFLGANVQDVILTANIRNLIKNFSLFIISWGFYYTSRR